MQITGQDPCAVASGSALETTHDAAHAPGMRRSTVAKTWMLLFMCASASAGPLYGTVRMGAAPAAGVTIRVTCPGAQPSGAAVTDAQGSYSLFVPGSGQCEMHLQRGSQNGPAIPVVVSDNALRFDFEIDGTLNRVR
jgi:hypothetical protein